MHRSKKKSNKSWSNWQKKQVTHKKQEVLDNLNSCISFAESIYNSQWNEECDFLGKLTKECKELLIDTFSYDSYLTLKKLSSNRGDSNYLSIPDYLDKKGACSCRLPVTTADRFETTEKNEKADCYKKYPQN